MAQTEYPEKLSKLIEEFRSLGDPELRTQMLIEYGESWQPIDESIAVRPYPETHRVPACESEAFLFTEDLPNGTLRYHFAIENPQGISAMAMASIIDETVSGEPLEEISKLSEEVIYEFFGRGISMGKGQGLMGMILMVRGFAKNKLDALER